MNTFVLVPKVKFAGLVQPDNSKASSEAIRDKNLENRLMKPSTNRTTTPGASLVTWAEPSTDFKFFAVAAPPQIEESLGQHHRNTR